MSHISGDSALTRLRHTVLQAQLGRRAFESACRLGAGEAGSRPAVHRRCRPQGGKLSFRGIPSSYVVPSSVSVESRDLTSPLLCAASVLPIPLL